MKEIEKIEASIYLYDCLKEVLPEYAVKFMKELKNKLEKSYKILDFSEDEIREFYSDSNVAPGIYLKFNETKIEDTDYYFTLKIEINTYEICNLTKLENNLGQNDVESRNGKKAVDMSLENTDFRKVSTDNKFLINLLEDDTRKEEVERVYKEIEDIVKKTGLK